jgi:hypothetical protein
MTKAQLFCSYLFISVSIFTIGWPHRRPNSPITLTLSFIIYGEEKGERRRERRRERGEGIEEKGEEKGGEGIEEKGGREEKGGKVNGVEEI